METLDGLARRLGGAALSIGLLGILAVAQTPSVLAQGTAKAVDVRVALSGGLDLLDPSRSANGTDLVIMSQIYETLLALDPKTGALKPNLAKSFELKSPTLWEFKLRNDVKFHDGTPFTAADVKYSIERILDPATNSAHYSQVTSVAKVTAVDEHTVQIETKVPDPLLVRRMQPIGGSGRVFIVPKHYFEKSSKQDVSDQPIGTGPYKLAEWKKGQSLTLIRNADYWGPAPDAAKGIFTFIPENSTRVNALLQGEVDVIQRVPISDVARVEGSSNAHVVWSPDGLVHTLLLDSRKPPFDSLEARKAFAHALNMKNVIGNLLGKYGRVLGVPMGPSVVQLDTSIQPYAYDRNLAKTALGGKTIEVETYTSDGRYVADREIYQAINAQLAQAGIKANPRTIEWGRLISMMQNRSGGPFYIIGWDFGEGDASKINSFLKSNSALSVTADPNYDALADKAGAEMDEAKRTDVWKQAQKLVHDQYYIAAVWQAASIYGFSKKLGWDVGRHGENLNLAGFKVTGQ
jgi:peptide/nickel transport system substrate-binding protein